MLHLDKFLSQQDVIESSSLSNVPVIDNVRGKRLSLLSKYKYHSTYIQKLDDY